MRSSRHSDSCLVTNSTRLLAGGTLHFFTFLTIQSKTFTLFPACLRPCVPKVILVFTLHLCSVCPLLEDIQVRRGRRYTSKKCRHLEMCVFPQRDSNSTNRAQTDTSSNQCHLHLVLPARAPLHQESESALNSRGTKDTTPSYSYNNECEDHRWK